MKRIILSLFLLCAMLGNAATASSIEFKANGAFLFAFDLIDGGNFMGKNRTGRQVPGYQYAALHAPRDNFSVMERIHLQLQAIASENLRGVVHFEIGEYRWGDNSTGGALGADSNTVKVKNAYLDWIIPDTSLQLRMGLQDIALPGFALDNPIFYDDVAAIVASYKFNDTVTLTSAWLRPFNDNWTGKASSTGGGFNSYSPAGYLDNMDLFLLTLPLRFEGTQVTPWAMGGSMGPNTIRNKDRDGTFTGSTFTPSRYTPQQPLDAMQVQYGLFPAAFSSRRATSDLLSSDYNTMFWGGVTAQTKYLDPWIFTADFGYGSVDNGRNYLKRSGWFGIARAEYAFSWGTPGVYVWNFSGDDGDINNGSESMPYISATNNLVNSLSSFGYRGNAGLGGAKGVLGTNPTGTRGIGARLSKVSFMDGLNHTLRVHYFGGTNAPKMASYITGRRGADGEGRAVYRNYGDFNTFGTYLTTADSGLEINADSIWKIYDNLSMHFELGYIHLWLDKDTWGKGRWLDVDPTGNSLNYKDAWKASLNFYYTF